MCPCSVLAPLAHCVDAWLHHWESNTPQCLLPPPPIMHMHVHGRARLSRAYAPHVTPCRACTPRSIVNDSYWLDAVLLYPPYLVALAAIYLACAYLELDVSEWFDKLNVNRAEVCCCIAAESVSGVLALGVNVCSS